MHEENYIVCIVRLDKILNFWSGGLLFEIDILSWISLESNGDFFPVVRIKLYILTRTSEVFWEKWGGRSRSINNLLLNFPEMFLDVFPRHYNVIVEVFKNCWWPFFLITTLSQYQIFLQNDLFAHLQFLQRGSAPYYC